MPAGKATMRCVRGFAAAATLALLAISSTSRDPLAAAPPAARAKVPASPPDYRTIRVQEVFIPMRDGVHLAASLFMPEGGKPGEKFPVLLEYLPYRKDDGTAARDYGIHSYFVHRGYVTARVDIRGTGRSEGSPPDREYSDREQEDGVAVIDWLSRQPWSNGNVGMFGISWGGFNSIQHAMRRPPALKAILACDATEDLFQDDVHYPDGLFHFDEYEISMEVQPAIGPSPDFSLDETVLKTRFDNPPWSLMYKKQQRNGPFWKRASLMRDYSLIQVPTFLIGGWLDGYRDSIPRMLTKMKAPVKALIGPWNHSFPHEADMGPRIEWRDDAVRFFDQFLKGRDTGIMDEPRVTLYMRHSHSPGTGLAEIPGEWRNETAWPPARQEQVVYALRADHSLAPPREQAAAEATAHHLKYVPSAGVEAGFWWGELLPDQRPVDAYSLVYDSEPLKEDVSILGFPRAVLFASATAPLADWFARLSDVAPDGSVTLVTGAGLCGAQRESDENPSDLVPGKVYRLDVEMHVTSWVFPKGHRVRLAVSNALWPMIWPTPYPMTTSLQIGGAQASRLVLPVVPAASPLPPPRFSQPSRDDALAGVRSTGGTWPGEFSVRRDLNRGATTVEWRGSGMTEYPWGRLTDAERLTYDVADDLGGNGASSISGLAETTIVLRDRVLVWRAVLDLRSDTKNFYYRLRRELLRDGALLREKTWEETLPRDHQ